MMKDTLGIEEYQLQVDYFEELKKVEERVAGLSHDSVPKTTNEDGLDDDYLMDNIMQGAETEEQQQENIYVNEYQDVMNAMSRLCLVIA